jgi:hypothetical protein
VNPVRVVLVPRGGVVFLFFAPPPPAPLDPYESGCASLVCPLLASHTSWVPSVARMHPQEPRDDEDFDMEEFFDEFLSSLYTSEHRHQSMAEVKEAATPLALGGYASVIARAFPNLPRKALTRLK